jgi:hypothetical protein
MPFSTSPVRGESKLAARQWLHAYVAERGWARALGATKSVGSCRFAARPTSPAASEAPP